MLDYVHSAPPRRQGLRFIGAALVSLAWSCAGDDRGDESEVARADASAVTYQLEVQPSEDEVDIAAGVEKELVAKLKDSDGEPVPDVPVTFALSGEVNDSSLRALSVSTDDRGIASNAIRAGNAQAEFSLRVSAAGAEPVTVRIKVAPEGLGTLVVTAAYSGDRNPVIRLLSFYLNQDCESLAEAKAAGMPARPRYASELQPGDDSESVFLPGGEGYAVRAEALGPDGMVVAVACEDEITLDAKSDEPVTVELEWADVPLTVGTTFDVHAKLATEAHAEYMADAVLEVMDERIKATALLEGHATDADPAAHLLDAIARTMAGAEGAANAPPLTDMPQLEVSLQEALEAAEVGPDRAAQVLAEDLRLGLTTTDYHFWLQIKPDPEDERGDEVTVYPVAISGTMIDMTRLPPTFALEEAAISLSDATVDGASGTLSFARARLPMPLFSLAHQVLLQVAARRDDAGDNPLREPMGCAVLYDWWQQTRPEDPLCDETCVLAACDRALGNLVTAASGLLEPDPQTIIAAAEVDGDESVEVAGGSLIESEEPAEPMVVLDGDFVLSDMDGDLKPDTLLSTSLTGQWQADGVPPIALSGEAEGVVGELVLMPE